MIWELYCEKYDADSVSYGTDYIRQSDTSIPSAIALRSSVEDILTIGASAMLIL